MKKNPLIVFDCDGVIVDGIDEYWISSKKSCLKLLASESNNIQLPNSVPEEFKYLRPWVQHGWEMVLLTGELIRAESPLVKEGFKNFSNQYKTYCKQALEIWGWSPLQLQDTLDSVRRELIAEDLKNWIGRYKAFPGVIDRLNQFESEDIDVAILTTKSAEFTSQLLNSLGLKPKFLFGYESGSKTDVLFELSKKRIIQGFVEDRLATLRKVRNNNALASIPCFLASWGYLKPDDLKNIPSSISLLDPITFGGPLANWN